jgi:4-alpha-glucanotransferase
VSRYSADVWANRELFDLDWSGGAPPETYFQTDKFTSKWGQNWGIPLYNWSAHESQHFAWWRQRVWYTTRIFHGFRIDHVLGFFRIYSFPWTPEHNPEFIDLTHDQAKEKTGGRLPQFLPHPDEPEEFAQENEAQGKKILEVILEAAGDNIVIAEDLGMVPNYVRPLLRELGIPGFSIPTFERNESDRSFKAKETLPAINLATYATHDHQPLVSFYEELVRRWHGPDGHEHWLEIQRLMKFLGWDESNPPKEFTIELHAAFLRNLLETPCWLAICMINDVLATSQRFNQPGSSASSNWSQRLDHTLQGYLDDPNTRNKIELYSDLIRETNRQQIAH